MLPLSAAPRRIESGPPFSLGLLPDSHHFRVSLRHQSGRREGDCAMDVSRRIARSRVILSFVAVATLGGLSGCSTFALEPSDLLPSAETWAKLSPSNLWYDLQPSRLQRLNEGDTGMSSDVYYSVLDPIPNDNEQTAVVKPLPENGTSVASGSGSPSTNRR
jgi:hypothetical protein